MLVSAFGNVIRLKRRNLNETINETGFATVTLIESFVQLF
jgi:hypothetical protein